MREVAVTEGDKVEVQAKLGWQVNTWPVGTLVETMNAVTDVEIDELMNLYRATYDFATDDLETVRYQAREEIAMKKMLDAEGCKAFSNTFQDLYGMKQLPGLASQHLMALGYGYGGEGRLEGGRHDRHPQGHERGPDRRHRLYGGLHLPSGRGSGVQPGRGTCWRSAPRWRRKSPASRCIRWASATASRPPVWSLRGTRARPSSSASSTWAAACA